MAEYSVDVCTQTRVLRRHAPRHLVLRGQTLALYDGAALRETHDMAQCHVMAALPTRPFLLELRFASKKTLRILVANAILHARLKTILEAAATSDRYALPPFSDADRLLCVAATVTERAKHHCVPSSGLTPAHIEAYIGRLKRIYDRDIAGVASPEALYAKLLDLEATYVATYRDDTPCVIDSFPHLAYQLDALNFALGHNPSCAASSADVIGVCVFCKRELEPWKARIMYQRNQTAQCGHCNEYVDVQTYYKRRFDTTAFDMPLQDVLAQCPHRHCKHPLDRRRLYALHVRNDAVVCPSCNHTLRYETFQIALFQREHPYLEWISDFTSQKEVTSRLAVPRDLPIDGCWETYLRTLIGCIDARTKTKPPLSRIEAYALKEQVLSKTGAIRANALGAFPIDLVRAMVQELRLLGVLLAHDAYWTTPPIAAAAVARYEQFMALHKGTTTTPLTPTLDIAVAWCAHRTQPSAYVVYSTTVAGGVVASATETDAATAYVETCTAWTKAYGDAYSSFVPTTGDGKMRVPRGDSRFFGVDDALSRFQHTDDNDDRALRGVIGTPIFDTRVAPSEWRQLLPHDSASP
ncbi:hypothetical protein SPRG_08387 [Saprolegnia parasitica CBS 223.65]|uniref:Uncharacterized protein n=1 Tax=Saprolegnia parasitica (strain CBS 223.65) TaxID=695850 RepID=A0A067C6B9_SAPPC|nr:hypothetical protein SPRG_08387 [Saprolegnia parasitica CBS 223.65]KDO26314.1 hypothetical protein SPRG_08387 [Saprolegnia parasitica CBS 223.65]|eukprot:XP_012203014.1 hypothetical protein SPRG_08387 [Saprolegnia parasitica CBS 223.65]